MLKWTVKGAAPLIFYLVLPIIDLSVAWQNCPTTNARNQRVRIYCKNYCCGNQTFHYCCADCKSSVYRVGLCVNANVIAVCTTIPILLLALGILIVVCFKFGDESEQNQSNFCLRSGRIGVLRSGSGNEPQTNPSPRSQGLMPPIPLTWLPAYLFPRVPKYEPPDQPSQTTPPPPFDSSQPSVRTPTGAAATVQPSSSTPDMRPTEEQTGQSNQTSVYPNTPPPSYTSVDRKS